MAVDEGTRKNPMARPMSPERRQELSEAAKKRHAEGRFGGPEFARLGGLAKARKAQERKERIGKQVAEAANKEAQNIIQVFKDAIHPNQQIHTRLKAAQAWTEIANQYARFEVQEEAQDQIQHSREELIEILAGKFTGGPTSALLRHQLEAETIADAEVVEE